MCLQGLVNFDVAAQLKADAGLDIKLCNPPKQDTIILGGNPTASGGKPPYKYVWFSAIPSPSHTMPASYYLDDTTAANPRLKVIGLNMVRLMVIDANGDFSLDEVQLSFKSPGTHLTDEKVRYIAQGQSATLFMPTFSGYPPYRYFWTPNYKISDTTAVNPVATPDTTTFYYVTIMDSLGCFAPRKDHCRVYVYPTNINELVLTNRIIEIQPNPIEDVSVIKLNKVNSKGVKIIIIDNLGQFVKEIMPNEFGESQISSADFEAGLYILQVYDKDKFVEQKKIVVN